MQVRELLTIEALQPITAQTGEVGLDRPMKDVVLLEYDSLQQQRPEGYYQDDFIVSTLYSAKDQPEALLPMVQQLIRLGAAGLAYKSVYYSQLPQAVLTLAKKHDFPILRFEKLYMEDVILAVNDYLRLRQEFSLYEEPLFKILQGSFESYGIEQLCMRMNPNRLKYMNAVYVHCLDVTRDWSVGLRNTLQLRSSRAVTSTYRFLQFRRGFFVLSNYAEPLPVTTIGKNVVRLFKELGVETRELCFGVGSLQQRSSNFDQVIRDAFDALLYALTTRRQLITLEDIRLYQTILPMVRDKTTRAVMQAQFQKLEEYDRESTSGSLMETLDVYAGCGYQIVETAHRMGQHPNTIRYRLKKICELTATPLEVGHTLFLMGEYRRMDNLSSSIF